MLYSRHYDAGLRFARRLMTNRADAEDIAHEAFLKVIASIRRGNGPDTAFRPYFLRAVRTTAADRWSEQAKETPTDHTVDTPIEDPSLAAVLQRDAPELVMRAFQSLPQRWMTVLWHAEVEREPPRRIAPVLGIAPGAVSALLLRARRGLREAYLSAYAEAPLHSECEPTFPYLAATVLGTSSARDRRKVKEHTRDCEDCSKVMAELTDVGATMRGILAPWFLIPIAALPHAKLLPRSGAARWGAALTAAAAVTVAIAAAAAAGILAPSVSTTALPSAQAPRSSLSQSAPAQQPSPPPSMPTPAPPVPGEPLASEQPGPANEDPSIFPEPVEVRNVTGGVAQATAPAGASRPGYPATVATSPSSAATATPTQTATQAPTPRPTAATPVPEPTPTLTETPTDTATPPTEPDCTIILIVCVMK
jgi:RNA polymerase sigma factor (sigma-70 family)